MILLFVNKHGLWSGNRFVVLLKIINYSYKILFKFYSKLKENSDVIIVNKDERIISSIFKTPEPL